MRGIQLQCPDQRVLLDSWQAAGRDECSDCPAVRGEGGTADAAKGRAQGQ